MKSLSAAGKFKKKRYQEENQKRKVKLEKFQYIKCCFLTIKINERLHWRVFSAGLKTLRPWRELWSWRDKITRKRMLFPKKYFIWLKEWVKCHLLEIFSYISPFFVKYKRSLPDRRRLVLWRRGKKWRPLSWIIWTSSRTGLSSMPSHQLSQINL